jgi:hypothetical protein
MILVEALSAASLRGTAFVDRLFTGLKLEQKK